LFFLRNWCGLYNQEESIVLKKILCVFMMGFLSTAYAVEDKLVLDNVTIILTAKKWVTTQSAKVQVGVNATLSNTDLVKARNEIMANLAKIAAGEWHITQFNRSQDSSGLERLYVAAQARVEQKLLTNVNVNAKSVSKPGATYRIQNIDFKPSLVEVQKVKEQVRMMLYEKITDELARLNKQFPSQKYSIHSVLFTDGSRPAPVRRYKAAQMNMAVMAAESPAISVSNQIQLTAVIDVASNRIKNKK
jgi:hypothetical protein